MKGPLNQERKKNLAVNEAAQDDCLNSLDSRFVDLLQVGINPLQPPQLLSRLKSLVDRKVAVRNRSS